MPNDFKRTAVDMLSRDRYGDGLAEWLWAEFMELAPGGGIFQNHRDYCGIGLMRTEEGAGLYWIEDGMSLGPPRIEWRDHDAFIRYWSAQSDFGLCGADPEHPEIIAECESLINNQRINRRRIYEFMDARKEKRRTPASPAGFRWSWNITGP